MSKKTGWKVGDRSHFLMSVKHLYCRVEGVLDQLTDALSEYDEGSKEHLDLLHAANFFQIFQNPKLGISKAFASRMSAKYNKLGLLLKSDQEISKQKESRPQIVLGVSRIFSLMLSTHGEATELINFLLETDNKFNNQLTKIFNEGNSWLKIEGVDHAIEENDKQIDFLAARLSEKVTTEPTEEDNATLSAIDDVRKDIEEYSDVFQNLCKSSPGYRLVRPIWREYCRLGLEVVNTLPKLDESFSFMDPRRSSAANRRRSSRCSFGSEGVSESGLLVSYTKAGIPVTRIGIMALRDNIRALIKEAEKEQESAQEEGTQLAIEVSKFEAAQEEVAKATEKLVAERVLLAQDKDSLLAAQKVTESKEKQREILFSEKEALLTQREISLAERKKNLLIMERKVKETQEKFAQDKEKFAQDKEKFAQDEEKLRYDCSTLQSKQLVLIEEKKGFALEKNNFQTEIASRNNSFEEDKATLEEKNQQIQKEVISLQNQLKVAADKIRTTAEQLAEAEGQVKTFQSKMREGQQEAGRFHQKEKEDASQISALSTQLQAGEKNKVELENRLGESERQLLTVSEKKRATDAKIVALEAQVSNKPRPFIQTMGGKTFMIGFALAGVSTLIALGLLVSLDATLGFAALCVASPALPVFIGLAIIGLIIGVVGVALAARNNGERATKVSGAENSLLPTANSSGDGLEEKPVTKALD